MTPWDFWLVLCIIFWGESGSVWGPAVELQALGASPGVGVGSPPLVAPRAEFCGHRWLLHRPLLTLGPLPIQWPLEPSGWPNPGCWAGAAVPSSAPSLPASRDLKYLLFVPVLFYFYKIFGKESPVRLSNARGAAPCGCSDTERGVCGSILVLFLVSGALGGRGSAAAFCWCFPAFPRWIRAGMRAQGLGVRHSQPPHAPVYV